MSTTPLREALQLAEFEMNAGRPGEALRSCDQLLGTHPRWLAAQRLKAKALVALNRLPDAEKLLDSVLASHPEDLDAFIDRAYLAQCKHDALGALACYRRACELARDNAALRAIHNQLAVQLGRPPYTPSHTGLARLYQRAELFAHALREWDVALQANPNRLDAQIGMAETLWRMGNPQRSQEVCRYILRHMPTCLKPLLLLVVFELDAGHAEEAQHITQIVAEMDPEQRVAGELLGDLVASGHTALAQLFRVAVRTQTSPLMANASQTGAFPTINGASTATGQMATGPLFLRPKTNPLYEPAPTSKLDLPPSPPSRSNPSNDNGTIEDFFSRSRASEIPAEFEYVFKETEYMLWSRDQEEPNTAEIQAISNTPPATPAPAAPPAEADMRFIRFLQEQGAHTLEATSAPASSRSPGESAAHVELPPFLVRAMAESAVQSHPLAAVPSQDETADDFMPPPDFASSQPFARSIPPAPIPQPESEPETVALPALPLVREETAMVPEPPHGEDVVSPSLPAPLPKQDDPETPAHVAEFAQSLPAAVPTWGATSQPSVATPTWENASSSSPAIPSVPAPDVESTREEPHIPNAATLPPTAPPPVTIEAIQHGLASAGFARLDTGRLASVASSLSHAPEAVADTQSIDADQHLEVARTLRRQGHMGEALVEYRALVKASTDRMPEIIRDLRDAAIEDPNEAEIHRLLGDAYIRQGDYVEALEAYNQASTLRHEVGH